MDLSTPLPGAALAPAMLPGNGAAPATTTGPSPHDGTVAPVFGELLALLAAALGAEAAADEEPPGDDSALAETSTDDEPQATEPTGNSPSRGLSHPQAPLAADIAALFASPKGVASPSTDDDVVDQAPAGPPAVGAEASSPGTGPLTSAPATTVAPHEHLTPPIAASAISSHSPSDVAPDEIADANNSPRTPATTNARSSPAAAPAALADAPYPTTVGTTATPHGAAIPGARAIGHSDQAKPSADSISPTGAGRLSAGSTSAAAAGLASSSDSPVPSPTSTASGAPATELAGTLPRPDSRSGTTLGLQEPSIIDTAGSRAVTSGVSQPDATLTEPTKGELSGGPRPTGLPAEGIDLDPEVLPGQTTPSAETKTAVGDAVTEAPKQALSAPGSAATAPSGQSDPAAPGAAIAATASTSSVSTTSTGDSAAMSRPLTAPEALPITVADQLANMSHTTSHRRVVLRLDPPDLGEVILEVRKSADDISVIIRAETADAVRALNRQHNEIQSAVQALGLELGQLDIGAGNGERHSERRPTTPTRTNQSTTLTDQEPSPGSEATEPDEQGVILL